MAPPIPFPISGTVTDVNDSKINGAIVEIFNLRTKDKADGETDSNGVYNIDLSNFPDFAQVENDPLLIRAYSRLFSYAEIRAVLLLGAGSLENQDITLIPENPEQPKDEDQKVTTRKEHHTTANAKKIINVDELGDKTYRITDRYEPTDEDASGDPNYFSFTDSEENWYIQEYNIASGTFRYAKGRRKYTDNWDSRATLTYDYFYNVF